MTADEAEHAGRPLTADEIRVWTAKLQQLGLSQAAFAKLASELSDLMGDYMLTQPGTSFVREADTAAEFAKFRAADSVRMCSGTKPDFEITVGAVTTLFETVEADLPGRLRTKGYNDARGQPFKGGGTEQDEMFANAAAIPGALLKAATDKASKGYDPSWALIIRVNIPTYGVARKQIEALIGPATEPAASAFSEVWVMWGQRFYRPWPSGWQPPPESPRDTRSADEVLAWLAEQGD